MSNAELIVQKKVFEFGTYTTVLGDEIPNLRFGYETFGTLNEAKDNAIFVPHFFSGSSHAAGKYSAEDEEPGYWDALIGPGKTIDTHRFFVIGVDSLNNINAFNDKVCTTGPLSVNPATGKPWGMAFPDLTTVDLAHVQKRLLASLGIEQLYGAIGASGGSIQSMQMAATYPESVTRVISVVPPGIRLSEYTAAMIEMWGEPIKVDAAWRGGDYYESEFPDKGLASSLRITTLNGLGFGMAAKLFPIDTLRQDNAKGSRHLQSESLFVEYLHDYAMQRKAGIDPNSLLKMVDTYQTFDIRDDLDKIQAKMLFIVCDDDLVFHVQDSLLGYEALEASQVEASLFRFKSDYGHLGAVMDTDKFAPVIADFFA
ncbi:MAG: homoserine O-acetyltransferase [Agarilytica sp.]